MNIKKRLKRILLRSLIVFTVAFIALGIFWYVANIPPDVHIPSPRMPSPNALDCYTAASKMVVEEEMIYWALHRKPSPKPGVKYREVPKVLSKSMPGGGPGSYPTTYGLEEYPPYTCATLKEREDLLRKNLPALRKLHEGLNYEFMLPLYVTNRDILCKYNFSGLSGLLMLEAYIKEQHGDFNGAMKGYIIYINFATQICKNTDMTYYAYNDNTTSICAKCLDNLVGKLGAADAKYAARAIEKNIASTNSYAQMMEAEKHSMQAMLQELFRERDWRSQLASTFELLDSQDHRMDVIRCWTTSKREIMSIWTKAIDERIRDARKPYPLCQDPEYRIADFYCPVYFADMERRALGEEAYAAKGLLALALALQSWKQTYGCYPASLKALVPSYLKRIPRDPFSLNQPLRYRRTKTGYLLYSLGVNCKDDGGKPTQELDSSKGDIVVVAENNRVKSMGI